MDEPLSEPSMETALKQGLPRSIIDVTNKGFRQRRRFPARNGARRSARGVLLRSRRHQSAAGAAVALQRRFGTRRLKYYRFQTPDDNMVDFYDENGRSMAQVPGAQTNRRGRDYSAVRNALFTQSCITRACTPASIGRALIGTPIYAAGNGVIIKAGWDGGYGRRVEIQHANGYVTAHNPMSPFGRAIAEGARASFRVRLSVISATLDRRPARTCITR